MFKILFIIVIIAIIWFFVYLKFLADNTPSIIWNNYDKNIQKIESELQKKIKSHTYLEATFNINNCYELIIQQYNNSSQVNYTKEFSITNTEVINKITNNLKLLPEKWEEYIKFSDSINNITLYFFCTDNKNYKVGYYWDKIKTPWTTFYTESYKEEVKIFEIINKLIDEN